jgi:hypothetical protein
VSFDIQKHEKMKKKMIHCLVEIAIVNETMTLTKGLTKRNLEQYWWER